MFVAGQRWGRAALRVRVQVRFTSSATTTEDDILAMMQEKNSLDVNEIAMQLNLPASELDRAMAALEEGNKLYRYTRRGQWDVLVRSPEAVVDKILREHSPEELVKRLAELEKDLRAHRQALSSMDEIKDKIDAIARRHPDHFASLGVVGMVGLWCLLFWMVFGESVFGCETFAFDWNLVEPITYFLGYSIVWFGVVFYYFTGQEYTYDNVRSLLEEKKRQTLFKREGFDEQKYESLKATVAEHERRIKELSSLKPTASGA